MNEYIDNLKRLRDLTQKQELNTAELSRADLRTLKSALSKTIEGQMEVHEDSFVQFYESVIQDDLEVNFSSILGDENYTNASTYAEVCLGVAKTISKLPKDVRVGTWILNSLKFIDFIVVHYIQEIKKEIPDNALIENDKVKYGDEKLRYKMLQRYEVNISHAGSWLLSMYEIRTRIVHNTQKEKATDKHIFRVENYHEISKKATKLYSKILVVFKVVYK